MKEKIIIDTDPGIDDAMAIFFAFQSPRLDVIGLTTVFGNVSIDMATQNAIILSDIADKNIPVCQGAANPICGRQPGYAHTVHGENGLGEVALPEASRPADPRSAVEFIIEMAKKYPGEITLVPVGPLTNLAHAIELEPELPKLLKRVVVMGGAARTAGNITPVAEANIWNDPCSAEIVFGTEFAEPITMIGLDVTYSVCFDEHFGTTLEEVNPNLGGFIKNAAKFYANFYSEVYQNNSEHICYFHDAMAIAHLIDPDVFKYENGHIRVSTDELCFGQTSFEAEDNPSKHEKWASQPVVKVAMKVDSDRIKKLYVDTYAHTG